MAKLEPTSVQKGNRLYKRLYQCPLHHCELTCRLKEKMIDHLHSHGTNHRERHLCGIGGCAVRFPFLENLKAHVRKEHPGKELEDTEMRKHRFACTVEGCVANLASARKAS
ncbi:hypothetical protein RvY_01892 [Ramazzottius varieornatus]|uniref:C2H2-type domain-containing protein n=1 Tax=Ramazzottius varieornatus TaxID=947166 RepID=A0A1D1USJ3_RAMVA|nr:hypothetical protein RvY_01892 [Ramazzottius varieornatus]